MIHAVKVVTFLALTLLFVGVGCTGQSPKDEFISRLTQLETQAPTNADCEALQENKRLSYDEKRTFSKFCYTQLAVTEKNPGYCYSINTPSSPEVKDCQTVYGGLTGDVEFCGEQTPSEDSALFCQMGVMRFSRNQELCSRDLDERFQRCPAFAELCDSGELDATPNVFYKDCVNPLFENCDLFEGYGSEFCHDRYSVLFDLLEIHSGVSEIRHPEQVN